MAAEISDRVREIAEARGLPESVVFERALERGLEELWEGLVLGRYLDGELDHEEAIERVGRTKVKRAEREREIVGEDVDWGLNARGSRLSRMRDRSFISPKFARQV